MQPAALHIPDDGALSRNITYFARGLRKAGLRIGSGRVIEAIKAVEAAGFTSRVDFYYTLQACFVSRPEERLVYDQLFRLFWRDPQFLEQMMTMLRPLTRGVAEERAAKAAEKRAAEALLGDLADQEQEQDDGGESLLEMDAARTASTKEQLKTLDFEQMSTAEMAEARRILAQMRLPVPPVITRRLRASPSGTRADWRATLRASLRRGGDIHTLARRRSTTRLPNLVVLCDISGSMSQYSRTILHFVHSVANGQGQGWADVHAFTFGTSLTNITRHLRGRDVDAALNAAGAQAQDWDGGTRIGESIEAFNKQWSRRVLGQGAAVILITDGLERGDPERLGRATARLSLSCRQLIWLNPLLRFDGFAPKAQGVAAMLPHASTVLAGHNIASLEGLAAALGGAQGQERRLRKML